MKSHVTDKFREHLAKLPANVQRRARRAYALFKNDPFHDSLQFKVINADSQIVFIRIGLHYRAFGVRTGDTVS
jgi:hypothetical protein